MTRAMRASLRDALPSVYRSLLPAFFELEPPPEEKATCASCAMCPPAGVEPPEGVAYFRADLKCCTYFPTLPNYLVGALLADADPALAEGQRRVRARIAGHVGVSPRWVEPSRKYRLLHKAARITSFGRAPSLRCPYYVEDGGLCSIWRHRESECATWYCKYDAGADGEAFWKALSAYLRALEVALSSHALSQVAPELPVPEVRDGVLTLEEIEDRAPAPAEYAALWGEWLGREEQLYLRCHEVVRGLGQSELAALTGGDPAEALAKLIEAQRRVSAPILPERLALGERVMLSPVEGGAIAVGYSRYDATFLSEPLLEVLRSIGAGETLAAARDRLRRDEIELPDELLVTLHRARILVEP
jgi:hypothetical protein